MLTGDEEDSGKPISISRKALLSAAKEADLALDFEPALEMDTATVARRGVSNWVLETKGISSHSAVIFQADVGFGAIFEMSRILDTLRSKLSTEKYLSFNPGLIIGGTQAELSDNTHEAKGYGKDNVIAQTALARGDLRFISAEQKESTKEFVTNIVNQHLPGTDAQISFIDAMPAMPPTPENYALLEQYSKVSEDLGFGIVDALDPAARGAGDISHVASVVPACLAGLGPMGSGMHTEKETIDLNSLSINTQRAALLIYRLTR